MVTRREKEEVLVDLEERFRKAQSAILADFQGFTVAEMTSFRKMAREAGVEFRVVKNTLAAIATRKAGIEGLDKFFEGPTGVAFGFDDPVMPAKIIDKFGKAGKKEIAFKGGYIPGQLLSAAETKALSLLPGKKDLLGQLVGTLEAPIAGLERVLAANLRGLAVALSRIAEKKSQAA